MNKIPNSYRVQKACSNCSNVFIYSDYEDDKIAYCGIGNSIRPLCNSRCFFENFYNYLVNIKGLSPQDDNYDLAYEELMDKWEEWCKGREVNPCGICDEYLVKEQEKRI